MTAKRTVCLWGVNRRLPVDPLDGEVRRTFTQGQCHSFARALHELTGWQLGVMCYDRVDDVVPEVITFAEAEEDDVSIYSDGDHVIVITPAGTYVDIHGEWQAGEHFEDLAIVVMVDDNDVAELGWDEQDVRAAMPFAKALLADPSLVPSYASIAS